MRYMNVRLTPELEAAIAAVAETERRTRSQVIRLLLEEALTQRRQGVWKPGGYIERFEGAVPEFGTTYRVTEDEWSADFTERVIKAWIPA